MKHNNYWVKEVIRLLETDPDGWVSSTSYSIVWGKITVTTIDGVKITYENTVVYRGNNFFSNLVIIKALYKRNKNATRRAYESSAK